MRILKSIIFIIISIAVHYLFVEFRNTQKRVIELEQSIVDLYKNDAGIRDEVLMLRSTAYKYYFKNKD